MHLSVNMIYSGRQVIYSPARCIPDTLAPLYTLPSGHDPFAAGNIKKLCMVKLVFFRCVLFWTAICLNFDEAIRPHTGSVICVCSGHLMLFKADFNRLHWLKGQR